MKVLVTGGCGFIGSHVLRTLLQLHPDWTFHNLDALTYAGRRDNVAALEPHPHYQFTHASICDGHIIRDCMRGVDTVIHLAAESHVDRSIQGPATFMATNVIGTQILLQTALDETVNRFLYMSTDEVYGHVAEGRVAESATLLPRSPYAASKAAADMLVQSYHTTYNLPTIILRPANTYGSYQYPEKLIPFFITQALQDLPLPLYGDGLQRRDWLHVSDLVAAVDAALCHAKPGSVYNVSSEDQRNNVDVSRDILSALQKPESLLQFVADRPGHDRRYGVDASLLRSDLGWQCKADWQVMLPETVQWYASHSEWWKAARDQDFDDYYHALYDSRLTTIADKKD